MRKFFDGLLRIIGWGSDAQFVLYTLGGASVVTAVFGAVGTYLDVAPWPFVVLFCFGIFLVSLALIGRFTRRFVVSADVGVMASAAGEPIPDLPPIGDLAVTYFRGRSIRIAELASEHPILRDRTFEDCFIYGPAILSPISDVEVTQVTFQAEMVDDLLYEVSGPRRMIGPIGLQGVRFRRCTFRGVGWMGSAEAVAQMRAAVNG